VKAYLEPVEVERLEKTAEYLRDKLLIRLLFHLGCRVSEALGIRAEDIDFKQGTVTIEHLKARIKLSCPQCGAGLGKMHKFCPVCGLKVEKAIEEVEEILGAVKLIGMGLARSIACSLLFTLRLEADRPDEARAVMETYIAVAVMAPCLPPAAEVRITTEHGNCKGAWAKFVSTILFPRRY